MGIQMVVGLVIGVLAVFMGFFGERNSSSGPGVLLVVLMIPLGIYIFWVGLAVGVKRWHDRDKSGWWMLIGIIPYIGGIWQLIECGCLRGTEGPNRFGGDPT